MQQLSGCPNDNCPKLFEDDDSYLVQGDQVETVTLPSGEAMVRVPKLILDVLKTIEG